MHDQYVCARASYRRLYFCRSESMMSAKGKLNTLKAACIKTLLRRKKYIEYIKRYTEQK